MEEEIWKDVVGFEDYFLISNLGRVFSKRTTKILVQGVSQRGYYTISSKIGGRKGVAIHKMVHRWVAEAFIENFENKPFVNHKDGDKLNNTVSNLEWVTNAENIQHAFDTGLKHGMKGFINPQSKLNSEDILWIRENHKRGCKTYGSTQLAIKFNVCRQTINAIIREERYK